MIKFLKYFVAFQIGSFYNGIVIDDISSSISIDGKLFAIIRNGEFGRVEIEEGSKISFVPLSKSKFESLYSGNYFLFHV